MLTPSTEIQDGYSQLAVTSATGLSANVRRIPRMTSTASELALTRLREHRKEISDVLARYGASNPRLFGSIAKGNAGPDSDVDLLLDLQMRMLLTEAGVVAVARIYDNVIAVDAEQLAADITEKIFEGAGAPRSCRHRPGTVGNGPNHRRAKS